MSLLLRSAPPTDAYAQDELLRRFVEAARRAQIVTIVNCAETEQELGELLTPELCEAFEAEIAVVLAGWDGEPLSVVGAYGLRPEEAEGLPEQAQDHLLHPDAYDGWVRKWGPPPSPLLWSHAMELLLAAKLER